MDWNVIVTVRPGPQHEQEALSALARFGRFRPTHFRDVCLGQVRDTAAFLEALRSALEEQPHWTDCIARVIPAEQTVSFTPETLLERLKEAIAPLATRVSKGSFCVRLERRGLAGRVRTQEIEAALGDHVSELAAAQGTELQVDLKDPDFVIAAEIVGQECGVSLLSRALRERYPFVQTR